MSDPTRSRLNAAFEEELAAAPVPAGLRAIAVRDAITVPRGRSDQPRLLALVATLLAIAIVATLVVGSHALRSNPIPSRPVGSTIPPAARAGAGVAYDQAHGLMVIFGGETGPSPALNETWTWDGKTWVRENPAASPSARRDVAMAYDEAHHDVVLFGGDINATRGLAAVNDTWTWNGSTWQQMHPEHAPSTGGGEMAFDPITRTVLLFRLTQSNGSETWSWNGSDWKLVYSGGGPSDTSGTMASDGQQLLVFGGTGSPVGGRYLTQTWAWDGSRWSLLNPKVNLPLLGHASGAYDPARGRLVALTGDTWTWDGANWSRQHPALQPLSIGYMVYMASLHEVVSWGETSSSTDNEMFGWDGANWKLIEPGTTIPATTDGKGGIYSRMSPDQAAATVRATVTNTHPLLLPTVFPSGGPYDVYVSATADAFNLDYESDIRDKRITSGIVVANPPPGGPNSSATYVKFRHAIPLKGATAAAPALYVVSDPGNPLSDRWIMWTEPGTSSFQFMAGPGVPYFLSAEGLTDQEFWQLANSLQ
ncbi:MAG TPA: kelch repeat-containing protein [Candidatus Dormibacteraeota bacterium]|jgi:hypothetical protein